MPMRDEKLAQLRIAFDEETGELAIHRAGKQVVRGTPKLLKAPGHMFTDTPEKFLSLISLASITDLERVMRADVDPRRFRAHIYFEGAPALGRVRLDRQGDRDRSGALSGHGTHRPLRGDQRQSGDRGPRHERRQAALGTKRGFGHIDMGVYAKVIGGGGGEIATGDRITLA